MEGYALHVLENDSPQSLEYKLKLQDIERRVGLGSMFRVRRI